MKSALGSAIVVQAIFLLLNVSAPGAGTNYWLKSTNGFWHQAEWSLGTYPGVGQSVALVSTRSKTLTISAITARDRPNSLQISNLFVFAPHHSINHLFLSRVGLSNPLRVGHVFNLSENAVLTLLDSTLRVGREFQVNSTVNHGAASQVIAADLHVGAGLTAYYNFTNGLISAQTLFIGHKSPATFLQHGGRIVAGPMEVREATYSLHGGDISADSLIVAHLYEPAEFHHHAGNLTVTNTIDIGKNNGHGRYFLSSGTLKSGGGLSVRGSSMSFTTVTGTGEFTQTGGSNFPSSLVVGRYYSNQGPGIYRLSGGWLVHGGGSVGEGGFEQSGGIHKVEGYGQFTVHRVSSPSGLPEPLGRGQYTLESGIFSSRSLSVDGGVFTQRGGTNEVTDSLWCKGAGADFGYELIGGKLVSTNVAAREMGFRQTGGTHEIRGFLSLAASPAYELSAGDLSIANGAYLGAGAVFRRTGGTLRQRGTITFSGGRWECGPGEQHLGALQLDATSTITLPPTPAVLQLGSSAAMSWQPTDWARLVIENWSGSENGGGQHQIFFGTNANGLTTQQLAQVRFRNPPGYALGDYPATILPMGEVIPILPVRPRLTFTWALSRSNMVHFHFADGLRLQAATNVAGPFVDLPALSPFPIILTNGPRRFFRLREP